MEFITNEEATRRIKSIRVLNCYTQAEMAKKLGVSLKTYNRYENNPLDVPVKVYQRMANILGCKTSDFFVTL
jgi:DNA-binding XRE family transcriptional regulator